MEVLLHMFTLIIRHMIKIENLHYEVGEILANIKKNILQCNL